MKREKSMLFKAGVILALAACLGTARAGTNGVTADFFRAVDTGNTNYFLGKTGIGTNDPVREFHVVGNTKLEGGVEVTGAFQVPKQGDVNMGPYTNGISDQGLVTYDYFYPLSNPSNYLTPSSMLTSNATIYIPLGSSAFEINAAIAAVPHNLNGRRLTIEIEPGTYTNDGPIGLGGFFGGEVIMRASNYTATGSAVLTPPVTMVTTGNTYAAVCAWNGDAALFLKGMTISSANNTSILVAYQADMWVRIEECYLKNTHSSAWNVGFCSFGLAARGSVLNCYFDKLSTAVQANAGGWVVVNNARTNGTICTTGLASWGGIIHKQDANVIGTTATLAATGGLIVNSGGKVLP